VRPLWSADAKPTSQAWQAIATIDDADAHGLRRSDYDIAELRGLAALLPSAIDRAAASADFDMALSRTLVRFIADLHRGRVDPRTLGFGIPHAEDPPLVLDIVRRVTRAADVRATIAAAAPRYAGYAALVRALARYRELAADTTLQLPRTRVPIRPGDPYPDVAALAHLLAALGDLAPDARAIETRDDSVSRYAGAIVPAVAAFQRRHGLEPDSVIGAATLAALRIPLARRVRQIELTLERWRWLPDAPPPRYVVVNIPAFRLYAFENDPVADQPVLGMKVIVGQAQGRHATPMFTGEMREVVFRPSWEVPPRIARNELVPLIRRDPDYMQREALEIVQPGAERDGPLAQTSENLTRVASGALRLRQRPGPNNALGLVKFVFPNDYNVYLHDTPAQSLFDEPRRDFSHGCIRAEQPAALATLVLRDHRGWDSAAVHAAMHGNRTVRVRLERPVTVYVVYATVVARGETIYFYPDLYGRDAALADALEERIATTARP
jgi:murein L,D-transpeptidase YcbB/YkuD